jgi:predicted DNA-binding transcriptional regulator AlpA
VKSNPVRPRTVSLVSKLLKPWIDEGVIGIPEGQEIISNLRHLSQRGKLIPTVPPKLLNQEEAAAMLGISKSNLKRMEADGKLPVKRKMVGTSVRYRSSDIVRFIMADDQEIEEDN